jgi:excisionase family DNA binding protein
MQMLTEQQAANLLNVTPAALRRWRRERRGPRFAKLGRLVRYKQADIEEFVQESTKQSVTPYKIEGLNREAQKGSITYVRK